MSDYSSLGIVALARATHKAENEDDDITFLALMSEVERRPGAEQEAYRLEYIRQMGIRAEKRKHV